MMVDWVKAEALIKEGVSDNDIAKELGCYFGTIKKRRLEMGILRSHDLDYEIMDVLIYINASRNGVESDKDVAEIMECSPTTVGLRRRALGIKKQYTEYASSREGARYYPDIIQQIINEITKEYGVKGDFKTWAMTHQAEMEQWNAKKQ